MSGVGNTATGATIFSDNTVSGGPNDVTVSNLVVQQDMRVDGNFEVGTFSIDDLTVNNNLVVDDNLTVGDNIYANYVETVADANIKGSLFLENNIVGNGLSYDRPLKRLRVDNGADVSDMLPDVVKVTNGTITNELTHNKINITNTGSTRQGHIHLTGTELEVGTTTNHPVEIITNNVPRITVQGNSGNTTVTGVLTAGALATSGTINTSSTSASTSSTTGALIVGGGAGIAGDINAGGIIRNVIKNTSYEVLVGTGNLAVISLNETFLEATILLRDISATVASTLSILPRRNGGFGGASYGGTMLFGTAPTTLTYQSTIGNGYTLATPGNPAELWTFIIKIYRITIVNRYYLSGSGTSGNGFSSTVNGWIASNNLLNEIRLTTSAGNFDSGVYSVNSAF